MAIGRVGKSDTKETQHETEYLSDESEFYGDEKTKEALEARVASFDVAEWWHDKPLSLIDIAQANIEAAGQKKSATLYNPYRGLKSGRQIEETVEEFLQRLPPATTPQSVELPWIYIANPYRKAPRLQSSQQEATTEGPPEDESDWLQFGVIGRDCLIKLSAMKSEVERSKAGKAKTTITKAFKPKMEMMVQRILDTAVELHCTTGKWMLFCSPHEVNEVWAVVASKTANNELGIAAKVAPDDGNTRGVRLTCIYTQDFSDLEDISRVLNKMRELGLVETKGRPIYYKPDAFTHLGLTSGNEWGIRASLYDSHKVFSRGLNPKDQKLEGYFYQKKDNND
ncbi:hypothetical protein B7494_g4444 [Chlorociboria aeruginascens]|nr:hypothetical protein B7494_g4444 [Chlorociboria aeruginascens]